MNNKDTKAHSSNEIKAHSLSNNEIKAMMQIKMEETNKVYRKDRAKLKLIQLVCYCDSNGIELNELIEEFNLLKTPTKEESSNSTVLI